MAWHSLLAQKYGPGRVEDVLHATPLADKDSVVMYVGPDQIRRDLRIRQHETGLVMDVRDDQRLVLFYGADDAAWVSSANLVDGGEDPRGR